MSQQPSLRDLPSVDRLLGHAASLPLIEEYGHTMAVEAVRCAIDQAREVLLAGGSGAPSDAFLIHRAGEILGQWLAPTLRRVINATGVIIHTNLGRAPLCDSALKAIQQTAQGYSNLEYELAAGKRGSRSAHAETLLQHITGAEAALVVNNNAAAVMLALSALAGRSADHPNGRGAIISRGQLVEIGGGFRIPDVMSASGAHLVEVGTTNRTHLSDYQAAITPDTALILWAHRSNFAIIGFATEPTLVELASLAHDHQLPLLEDLGSGALLDTAPFGLAPEPTVQDSLKAGANVVMFSGDKLLGGPQAGILAGAKVIIEPMRRHPFARAARADKLCLAALSATLAHYLRGDAIQQIPIWQMIAQSAGHLQTTAERWQSTLLAKGVKVELQEGQSAVGGGSLPGETLPTTLLAIQTDAPDQAAAQLRAADPPIIGRIENDRLMIDPRTVLPGDEPALLAALQNLVGR